MEIPPLLWQHIIKYRNAIYLFINKIANREPIWSLIRWLTLDSHGFTSQIRAHLAAGVGPHHPAFKRKGARLLSQRQVPHLLLSMVE